MADAIAYVSSLVTLDTQHRVRLLVDNDTYNEEFILPRYCDLQGESKAGVIFQHNDGDAKYSDIWISRPAFLSFYSDSLVKDATIDVTETTDLIAGVNILNGENLVTGRYDNLLIDCDQANTAIAKGAADLTINSVTDRYISTIIANCDIIAGGNTAVSFGSQADAFIGSLSFVDTNITGGQQLQGGSPAFSSVNFVEFWAVFFGHTFAKASHRIRPECNFMRCNIKQYDASWVTTGVQAFNLEYSLNLGSQSECIDSNFETVKSNAANGYHGTPIFVSGYKQSTLTINPNAKFSIYTDGCTFTKNATYSPSYDIRYWNDSGLDTPPLEVWGGNGTNPVLGETSGNP